MSKTNFSAGLKLGCLAGAWVLLAVLMGGCATHFQRSSGEGETQIYRAEWDELMALIKEEIEDRDYRIRHSDRRAGRITALSWVRTEGSYRGSRQMELVFSLEQLGPEEIEVHLLINEMEERDFVRDRPSVSRRPLRDAAPYRQILSGVEERLSGSGY